MGETEDNALESKVYHLICEKQIEKCMQTINERFVTNKALNRFLYGALITIIANVTTVITLTMNIHGAYKDVVIEAKTAKSKAESLTIDMENLSVETRATEKQFFSLDKKIDVLIASLKGR